MRTAIGQAIRQSLDVIYKHRSRNMVAIKAPQHLYKTMVRISVCIRGSNVHDMLEDEQGEGL